MMNDNSEVWNMHTMRHHGVWLVMPDSDGRMMRSAPNVPRTWSMHAWFRPPPLHLDIDYVADAADGVEVVND